MGAKTLFPKVLNRRYEPLRRLGAGAMGEVVAARDHLLERDVAVKLLKPDRKPSEGRLREEFALLASLDHPGVVRVHEVGMADQVLYLTADLLEGERLDAFLKRSPPPLVVDRVLHDLLATLAWLHHENVIHADLKPANILLLPGAEGPWPVLIDFGLSHAAGYPIGPLGGTPFYMAPELLRRGQQRPTPRSDLFALGRCFEKYFTPNPDAPGAVLVSALMADEPEDRPDGAHAALDMLRGVRSTARRLGGRGVHALWGRRVTDVVQQVKATPGTHGVQLPTEEDASAFLRAVKAALEIAGYRTLEIPDDGGQPLGVWNRVLACLGVTMEPMEVTDARPAPADQRELLEARAVQVIEGFRGVSTPPVVLVANPERRSEPFRHILARCIEAGVFERLVWVAGPVGAPQTSGSPVVVHEVKPPTKHEVKLFLKAHAVDSKPPDSIRDMLAARAQAGATALRSLLEVWVQAGVLIHGSSEGWSWQLDVDPRVVDAPGLDPLWARLWKHLPKDCRRIVAHLVALGGQAHRDQLQALSTAKVDLRSVLERLAVEGWTTAGASGVVLLHEGPRQRFDTGLLRLASLRKAERRRYVAMLEPLAVQLTVGAKAALATHLQVLGEGKRASEAWRGVALELERQLDTAGAGRAALASAQAAVGVKGASASLLREALSDADRALRLLEAAGDSERLETVLTVARNLGKRLNTAHDALRVALLDVRVSVHLGQIDDAGQRMEVVDDCAKALDAVDSDSLETFGFDRELMAGIVSNYQGNREQAALHLEKAAAIADATGDLHALGRVANNLGNIHLVGGRYREAEQAYERSIDAKRQSGDLRGQEVAELNRSLALRELGQLVDAYEMALHARELAERVGDVRGAAMGTLTLAQLSVDMGAPTNASQDVFRLEKMTIHSELVRVNASVVRARHRLACGEPEKALEIATKAGAIAENASIASLVREAHAVAFLARMRGSAGYASSDVDTLRRFYDEALNEGHARQQPLLGGCLANALVHQGQWDEARVLVETVASGLDAPIRPGLEPVIGLLQSAGRIVGMESVQERLKHVEDETVKHRIAAQHRLGARDEQSGEHSALQVDEYSVATALGIRTRVAPGQQLDRMLQPSEDVMEPTINSAVHSTLVVLDALGYEHMGDPVLWTKAIGDALGATTSTLFVLTETGPTCLTSHGATDGGERLRDLCTTVQSNGQPFAARGSDGTLETLGVLLTSGPKAPASGVLFLTWSEGKSDTTDAMVSSLEIVSALAAIVLDRARSTDQVEALNVLIKELEGRLVHEQSEHREEVSSLRDSLYYSRTEAELRHSYDHIVHQSDKMRRVLRTFDKVTDSDVTVLVRGESGVGKELLARALHYNGPRRGASFVAENCGAIPGELFESVFFGHVRGAFTGAGTARRGLVEAARGGTLFLDEVGELRPEHQVKLLRVLQERRFRPVGGDRELEADFRLIAATNRDLEGMVKSGEFREDLYYRLSVVAVHVPPLRERVEDIMPIAMALLDSHTERSGQSVTLSPDAAQALMRYDWPGNVRELENEMMRASVLAEGKLVKPRHLSAKTIRRGSGAALAPSAGTTMGWDGEASLEDVVARVERSVIEQALRAHRGKKAPVARVLGISRPGLDAKIRRHEIDVQALKKSPLLVAGLTTS